MADKRSPRESKPVPVEDETNDEDLHNFNPVEEDIVAPGIVPPEGHDVDATDIDFEIVGPEDVEEMEEYEEDLAEGYVIKTQRTDGSTWNPIETMGQTHNQGLVYTPPDDPPVVPGGLENVEMGVGYAPSAIESNPDVRDLPEEVDNQDWDLVEDIEEMMRMSSHLQHLDDIHIEVEDGVVTVRGTVSTADDLGLVESFISDMPGVVNVFSEVELSDDSID
jgi:hypothetical protein